MRQVQGFYTKWPRPGVWHLDRAAKGLAGDP